MSVRWLAIAAWLAAGGRAQAPAPPATAAALVNVYMESVDNAKKLDALTALSQTPPASGFDIEALYNLFERGNTQEARQAAVASFSRLDARRADLEPFVFDLLSQPDPDARFFGVRGALRLRSQRCLPLVEKLARQRLSAPDPSALAGLEAKNAWWTQYEAVNALALWKGAGIESFVLSLAKRAPKMGRILGEAYWPRVAPELGRWSAGSAAERAMAYEAAAADVPQAELRSTRPALLAYVRDAKAARELRHQLAIKVGLTSTEPEVAELIQERAAAADAELKLFLTAAIFASRSKQAAPLLLEQAKSSPDAGVRAAARLELKDVLEPAPYRELLQWASEKDPDADNRRAAAAELSAR